MMYFSVSRAWLFSRTSQRVYLLCAILDLAFLGTQLGITMAMSFAEVYSLPSMIRIIVGCALVPEVIGTAVLAVGMTWAVALPLLSQWSRTADAVEVTA